jgi:hypothetical protein
VSSRKQLRCPATRNTNFPYQAGIGKPGLVTVLAGSDGLSARDHFRGLRNLSGHPILIPLIQNRIRKFKLAS